MFGLGYCSPSPETFMGRSRSRHSRVAVEEEKDNADFHRNFRTFLKYSQISQFQKPSSID
ncbi:unnamed protein product [Sphenostylis stenocarpa]|uniref:Uncharacterized protein n=1 Tax=Sphenostylis stenocarpa TaxID=92480 RepID=A0AA86SMN8_9FABA|nr:unnamed protein product [Sphenostylis stenocarpa]